MPTLFQFAALVNMVGALMVLLLSWITLRQWPSPFFRSWVIAYGWMTVMTVTFLAQSMAGPTLFVFSATTLAIAFVLYYQCRMAFQLLKRRFPAPWVIGALGLGFLVGEAIYLTLGHHLAIVPASLGVMITLVSLGGVMVRVGGRPEYAGMGWIGGPVIAQGLWLLSLPVLAGTPVLWAGQAVNALLQLGVGFGMAVFVLHRTARQLEFQNLALSETQRALRETQAEQERLQEAQIAHLEEMDRLKRDFLNAASHELRTPLTSILGYAEFLEDAIAGPLTPTQGDYVSQIQNGAQRLRRIVDDMLDFARLEAGTFSLSPQPSDVREVVRDEAASMLPQASEKGIVLKVSLPDTALMGMVDTQRIGQVVLNLVSNALKFTPAGGTVHLRACEDGDFIRVEVSDTGIGISPEHQARLFEKFYQVDPSTTREHGGAGLGLAISKALVESHGGAIGVESLPNVGSTFWFTLPRLGTTATAAASS